MGPLTRTDVGAALIGLGAAVVLVLAVVVVMLVRSARAERVQLAAELARSRSQVDTLSRRVEELADDVDRAGRAAALDREYVITSLAGAEGGEVQGRRRDADAVMRGAVRPPRGRTLEDQLVGTLARHQGGSPLRRRGVELVVRTVALGHGVRRALSPDNLDRAAAEAHVARRRSRRDRRRELREARRLVRVVRTQQHGEDVA